MEKPNAWIFLGAMGAIIWFQLGPLVVLLVLGVYAFLYVRPHKIVQLNRHENVARHENASLNLSRHEDKK